MAPKVYFDDKGDVYVRTDEYRTPGFREPYVEHGMVRFGAKCEKEEYDILKPIAMEDVLRYIFELNSKISDLESEVQNLNGEVKQLRKQMF